MGKGLKRRGRVHSSKKPTIARRSKRIKKNKLNPKSTVHKLKGYSPEQYEKYKILKKRYFENYKTVEL